MYPPDRPGLTAQDRLDDLLKILDLSQLDTDRFAGESAQVSLQPIFGGQVAAQSLVAAHRTTPAGRDVHSLHAYFLRPGDPKVPIEFGVERLRDGRSFSVRRVNASQHGKSIFTLTASFQVPATGLEHQVPMPAAPDPDTLPPLHEHLAPYEGQIPAWFTDPLPIDVRHVGDPPYLHPGRQVSDAHQQVWMRAAGTMPDDPLLHACVIVYASDMTLLDSTLLPHPVSWLSGQIKGASLDHAMWFHRPARADQWLLFAEDSPAAAGARGFARAHAFTPDGQLVLSVAQEGMLRVID